MVAPPQSWHYGLMAQWWAEFNVAVPELDFYRGAIERCGQPALDLACGTGRLLVPLREAGLDVDGCDLSPDMLACCRARAERTGVSPRLYAQAMHALDLPRRYRTIYICDSFGIGGQRCQDAEALRCCFRVLEPGGALVFNHYLPDQPTAEQWRAWAGEERRRLPEAWAPTGDRRLLSDGSEIELRVRRLDVDPLEQRLTLQMRVARWREGERVAEEERALQETIYFRDEVLAMLSAAGFGDVAETAGYTNAPATTDDKRVVFFARR